MCFHHPEYSTDGGEGLDVLLQPSHLYKGAFSAFNAQVLHSSKAIMELFKAGRWEVQQRLSHCSRPAESMSFAALHTGCERLSKQLRDLLRDPVNVPSSKVHHQVPCLVKQPRISRGCTWPWAVLVIPCSPWDFTLTICCTVSNAMM